MFYIDENKSKTIIDAPPSKIEREKKIAQQKKDLESAFWQNMGMSIAQHFPSYKHILKSYGYEVENEHEAADAVSNLYGGKQWSKFLNDVMPILGNTLEKNVKVQ